MAVAIGLRVAAALALGNTVAPLPGTFDQVSYHALALRVAGGHGFSFATPSWPLTRANAPTAHWSFLYTLYLAALYALGATPVVARVLQAALAGAAQPLITFALARRAFDERVALVAAALVAIYAYFVYYAATLMTESFYIVGILASLLLATRLADALRARAAHQPAGAPAAAATAPPAGRRGVEGQSPAALALALGVALGTTLLLRQVFGLFVPFLVGWIVLATSAGQRLRALAWSALALVVAAAMILPWTAYNARRFDTPVLLNTNAGFAFFWANHPIYGTHFYDILPAGMGSYQDLIPEELRGLDEAALDRALLRRGIGFVTADPARYVRLSLSRFVPYFKFWPDAASSRASNVARTLSFGVLLPFMLAGIALALRRGPSRAATLLLLFAAVYAAVHLLSWAMIRYRLPVDAVLLPFAALTIVAIWDRVKPSPLEAA